MYPALINGKTNKQKILPQINAADPRGSDNGRLLYLRKEVLLSLTVETLHFLVTNRHESKVTIEIVFSV